MIYGILLCYAQGDLGNKYYLITEPMHDSPRISKSLVNFVERSEGYLVGESVAKENPNKDRIEQALTSLRTLVLTIEKEYPEAVLDLKNGIVDIPLGVCIIKLLSSGYVE